MIGTAPNFWYQPPRKTQKARAKRRRSRASLVGPYAAFRYSFRFPIRHALRLLRRPPTIFTPVFAFFALPLSRDRDFLKSRPRWIYTPKNDDIWLRANAVKGPADGAICLRPVQRALATAATSAARIADGVIVPVREGTESASCGNNVPPPPRVELIPGRLHPFDEALVTLATKTCRHDAIWPFLTKCPMLDFSG